MLFRSDSLIRAALNVGVIALEYHISAAVVGEEVVGGELGKVNAGAAGIGYFKGESNGIALAARGLLVELHREAALFGGLYVGVGLYGARYGLCIAGILLVGNLSAPVMILPS